MTNYRNPKYLERYEDVVYELDTALNLNVANNASQKKDGYRFVADNSGETTPLDWYHARFNVDFKLVLIANGNNIAVNDHNGMVNSAHSLIKKLIVKMNGINVYTCSEANHATNIKNLLEYSQGYSRSQGTNEFYYLDTTRSAEEREFTQMALDGNAQNVTPSRVAGYNKGFAARKALLGVSATVNTEIPLNRYSFFESLYLLLLPTSKIKLEIDIENDTSLVWQAGANCRVVITKFQLIVPRIVFNAEGKNLYMNNYVNIEKPLKWNYLRELVTKSDASQQQTGSFRISTGINKPRHVFVFIIDVADENVQTANKFLYKTFSVSTDPRTLTSCHLEVGVGREYPHLAYKPSTEPNRVFRDVLRYVHANSRFAGDTLLNRTNFNNLFPFIYFDLTKQPTDIKDGMTKLTFKYELSGATATAYSIYSLILYEQEIEMRKTDGKLTLRSM